MSKTVYLVFLFLLLVITRNTYGQKVEFEHLTNSEGLVSSKVTTIVKDYQGYMWFGTYEGLSRYDGYSFTNFLHDPKDSNSLSDNFVKCIYETKDSILLLGFQSEGLAIFDRKTETFTKLKHNDKDPGSIVHDFISSIHQDARGNIWIGTQGGLEKFDPKTRKFSHYKPFVNNEFAVTSIDEDDNHILWLYGRNKVLCKFDPKKGTFEYIDFMPEKYKSKRFHLGGIVKVDSKKNIWVGDNGGLFKYNPTNGDLVTYNVENKKLQGNIVTAIMEDAQKNIWVGCDGGGVYKYSYSSDSLETFVHDENIPTSLSGNGTYCIYESDPGIIWIGVYSGGVNIYKKFKQKFKTFTTRGPRNKTLSNKSVFCVTEMKDGKVWMGTDGGGINILDPQSNKIDFFKKDNSIINTDIVKCISIDNEENVWLGSYGGGLSKINFKKNTKYIFPIGNDPQKNFLLEHVWSLYNASDTTLYFGLLSYGLQAYHKNKNTFSYYPFDTASVKRLGCNINAIIGDHTKKIWFGSFESGVGCLDPVTNKIINFIHDSKNPSSLSNNNITDIFEDSKHNIWIATNFGGLNKLVDFKSKTFKSYNVSDGLPSNAIRSILEDTKGNLWLSTDNGISKFNTKINKFVNFTVEDGIVNPDYNSSSKLKASNGYLYFGGIDGISKFHPDSIKFNQNIPKVVITDFKILNNSIKPFNKYGNHIYLNNALAETDKITLYPDDNIFSIDFAALDFISSSTNQYAYKLSGFNNTWTHVKSDKRFATYTNLDPGEYIFNVIACNNDGLWNNHGASLKIIVLPPWWETLIFRIFITICFFAVIIGYYYFRLKSIEQRNKDLSDKVQKRTHELKTANDGLLHQKEEIEVKNNLLLTSKQELEYSNKTKDKFFSIIGHDLKGPVSALTTLSNFLKLDWNQLAQDPFFKATDTPVPANIIATMLHVGELINHVDKSSFQIKSLVINLLEWARTQSGQVKLRIENIKLTDLVVSIIALLEEQAGQKEITIVNNVSENHMLAVDSNMISTIIRNILSNSIKYTPKGGSIYVSSEIVENNLINISIRDTGIGMTKEVMDKLFSIDKGPSEKGTEKETGTGLGLVISQEFAQLHNGNILVQSVRGEGSTFIIVLPYLRTNQ